MTVLGTIVSQTTRYVPTYTIASNSHTFTTCGLTGRVGPTQAEMRAAYDTSANGNWDETYITQGQYQGYQDWKVPVSGTYQFSVMGASGYNGPGAGSTGRGARIIGRLRLVKDEIITIAVGQSGAAPVSGNFGGSGGGTFVIRKTFLEPLFIAGGGSGEPGNGSGRDGVLTNNGGVSTNLSAGGTNGFGGLSTNGRSAGGGGFLSRGGNAINGESGGGSFLDGLSMGTNARIGGYGGFGGGGQSDGNQLGQSGGGGGYSGGAGARSSTAQHAGGGGGSYISSLATNVSTSTGLFNGSSMSGGYQANRIIRLNSDGTRDTAFFFGGANNTVNAVGLQSDGKIIVGGNFTIFNGTSINRITRLNSNGTTDTVFSTNIGPGTATQINSIVVQPDQKILVGGIFTGFNVSTVGRIIRLNSDGTTDTSFVTNTGTGANLNVNTIAVQSDGKILLGGTFTSFNGTLGINRIVRLNSDGTRDTSFSTNNGVGAASTVNSIAVQSDGKIIVGGDFLTFNGTTVNRIVRLNSDGTRDTSFTTNTGTGAPLTVSSIAVQPDQKIIVAGSFNTFNGVTVAGLVRLNSDGTRDTLFTTNNGTGLNGGANSAAVQSDGKIIVGGSFTAFNDVVVYRIVRLNADGTRDTEFMQNIGTGFSNTVFSTIFQTDGKPIIVGALEVFNGMPLTSISLYNTGQGSVTVTLL